jgi:aerobic carbon-monoxide dehydrogenase small subunit
MKIALTVNGTAVSRDVEPRLNLVDFLREGLQLTGSHVGCEHGVCGACTVRVDGALVRGCLMVAVQADGGRVETIEGVAESGAIAELQRAFRYGIVRVKGRFQIIGAAQTRSPASK